MGPSFSHLLFEFPWFHSLVNPSGLTRQGEGEGEGACMCMCEHAYGVWGVYIVCVVHVMFVYGVCVCVWYV